jgi:hypothetical protein
MIIRGFCPLCQNSVVLPVVTGSSLKGHTCPRDGSQLVGRTALYCNVRCSGIWWTDPKRGWITLPIGQGEPHPYNANCSRPKGHPLPHGSADGKRIYEAAPPRCGFVGHEVAGIGVSSFRYRCREDRGHEGDHRTRYHRLTADGKP